MIQPLSMGRQICHTFFVLLVLVFSSVVWRASVIQLAEAALLPPVTFKKYAQGSFTTSAGTYHLPEVSVRHCAGICRKQLTCGAFTVSNKKLTPVTKTTSSASNGLETNMTYTVDCTYATEDFSWTPSTNGTSLYMEDMENYSGYTLAEDGFFYKGYSDLLSMTESKIACFNEDASLASPYPQKQYNILRQFAPNNSFVWLGLFMWFDLSQEYFFRNSWVTDGNDFFTATDPASYPGQRWASSEPTLIDYVAGMQSTGYWKVTSMVNLGTRVCRRHKYYRKAPRNGKYYKMHFKPAPSQEAANEVCQSEGGRLAIIRNKSDLEAVRGYWNPFFWGDNWGFYVAGTDAVQEGVFVMPDGSSLHAPTLTSDANEKAVWRTSQPDGGANENCLRIATTGQMHDCGCNFLLKFLCEIAP